MPRFDSTRRKPDYNILVFAALLTVTFLLLVAGTAYLIFGLSRYHCVFVSVLFIALLFAPRFLKNKFRPLTAAASRFARRRTPAVILVGVMSFMLCAGLSLFVRMPEPNIHDEFSYLLASDTFAHGRLTNPPHPMWVHLESFHVIFQPTYASKFPPAQGLMLAFGQAITGRPIVGAWLSTALACALICWMLMAWVPARWALLGGLMALVHPIILTWSQSYWGGSIALAGGALLLGAFRRTVQKPRIVNSLMMGFGMAVLANSRPYEGLVLSVLLMCALVVRVARETASARLVSLARIGLPVLFVLSLTAGAMAFYNKRVTGDAFRMPYMVHEATYAVAPPFLLQHLRAEPVYYHKEFRYLYVGYVVPIYTEQLSLSGLLTYVLIKLIILASSCYWLLIPSLWLLGKPSILRRDGWMRLVALICGLFVVALLLELWVFAHYAAPAVSLLFIFAVQGMRYLRSRRFGGPGGRLILRATLAFCVTSFAILCFYLWQVDSKGWNYQRARMVSKLRRDPDRHLIIVRYGPEHNVHQDWVFNDADIDGSKVVWARDMGSEQNKELLSYFKDRRVWLLEPDIQNPGLVPYLSQQESRSGSEPARFLK